MFNTLPFLCCYIQLNLAKIQYMVLVLLGTNLVKCSINVRHWCLKNKGESQKVNTSNNTSIASLPTLYCTVQAQCLNYTYSRQPGLGMINTDRILSHISAWLRMNRCQFLVSAKANTRCSYEIKKLYLKIVLMRWTFCDPSMSSMNKASSLVWYWSKQREYMWNNKMYPGDDNSNWSVINDQIISLLVFILL